MTSGGSQSAPTGRRFTLSSRNKLKNRSDFEFVKTHSIRIPTRYFTLLAVRPESPDECLRCGVICSRKFHKRAVARNRARRLIWESFRLLQHEVVPCQMIVIPRREILTVTLDSVLLTLRNALRGLAENRPSRNFVSDLPRRGSS